MTPALVLALSATMVATSFLSGIFGMAGGLILVGILLALLPVPDAMALHAITQMASNGWRGLLWWRHVRWRAVAAYLLGCALAMMLWSAWRYVPEKSTALLLLGVTPFLARVVPAGLRPDPESFRHGTVYGAVCMTLLLLTGVAGPLLDSYFLGGTLERRQIVATKSVCQIFGHAAKLAYFSALVDQTAVIDPLLAAAAILASMIGTTLARPILDMMTDRQYRAWAGRLVTTIAGYYVAHGSYLLFLPLIGGVANAR
jgi:uncharacterized membrane protein YfcA